jgi:hypothetical protein
LFRVSDLDKPFLIKYTGQFARRQSSEEVDLYPEARFFCVTERFGLTNNASDPA